MQTWRRVRIAGIGKALPSRVVTSAELEQRLRLEPGWIERKTGVRERRHATGESASQLGADAARAALSHAGATLADVDLVVCAAASSEQTIPCTAVLVQKQLGPGADGIPCFDVDATCLSFVYGIDVAAALVQSGAYRGVLVVSPEIGSPAIDWSEEESCVLLGDGAAAVLVTPSAPGETSAMAFARFQTWSEGAALAELRGCGSRYPPNVPTTTPEMNLFHMQGPRIFKFAQRATAPFVRDYLRAVGWEAAEVGTVAAHQASLFALRSTARACGFTDDQVLENIQDHGNCVAASIPMVLHDGVRSGRVRRGDRVLLAGTAAGLSVGALALTY
jgi:3-oxoacyl-[acyl-carrier-protein] synthase-3